MRRIPSRACLAVVLLATCVTPASAEGGAEPVAGLLASIRVLKLECRVKPAPNRLSAAVEAAGYALAEFLPGGRQFGLVQAKLREFKPPSRSERSAFCARLAERVRASPLNTPRVGAQSARYAGGGARSGLADLNRASLEELNSLGAGMIGRTIIYGRPYRSPEDLLDRRLLNARDFERIRTRVTVR